MAWWEGFDETRILIAPDTSTSGEHDGQFLSLRHPKSGDKTCYLYSNGALNEIHWFKQSYGSWFLGDYVCEDGRLYTATPVDPVFILLPIFEEARLKKGSDPGMFRQLDEIVYVHGYPGYHTLASIADNTMEVVCDIKEAGSTKFFRLNDEKVQNWMCYKVNQLKKTLPTLDKNYASRDEKDKLIDSASIVGEYLKEDPWLKLLCDKLKINLQDLSVMNAPDKLFSPSTDGIEPYKPAAEEKKPTRVTRQTKKAKLENNSHNIKDMFSRATRKGK